MFLAIKPIAYSVGFPAGNNIFIIIWWGLKFGHVLSLVFTPGQQINKRFPLTDEDAYDVDDGDDDEDDDGWMMMMMVIMMMMMMMDEDDDDNDDDDDDGDDDTDDDEMD